MFSRVAYVYTISHRQEKIFSLVCALRYLWCVYEFPNLSSFSISVLCIKSIEMITDELYEKVFNVKKREHVNNFLSCYITISGNLTYVKLISYVFTISLRKWYLWNVFLVYFGLCKSNILIRLLNTKGHRTRWIQAG